MSDKPRRIINTVVEYQDPTEAEIFSEQEQIDTCCEVVSSDPCYGIGRVSPFISREQEKWNFDPDLLAAPYQQQYGDLFAGVKLVPVGPHAKHCGKKIERWSDDRLNCCDLVEPLEWDTINSARTIAPGTKVVVKVNGGAYPAYVTVRGNGFTLDGYNLRNGWVDGGSFFVFASPDACGYCPITVDDGCTKVKGDLYCTVGEWVLRAASFSPHCLADWQALGLINCSGYDAQVVRTVKATSGRYSISSTGEATRDLAFQRISHSCGHWATNSGVSMYYVEHPYAPGLAIPALALTGSVYDCGLGGGLYNLYNYCQKVSIYEFVC